MAAPTSNKGGPSAAAESVYFSVEGAVFHVVDRRVFTRDSEFFQELFALPQESTKPIEGSSADAPIRVEGVKKDDFALLLRVMFPEYICQDDSITTEQWMTILHFLHMWRFKVARESVLVKLSKIAQPCYKIVLHRTYSLDAQQWLIPAAKDLAKRTSPLTEAEARILGFADAASVAAVREHYFCDKSHNDCRNSVSGCCAPSTCPSRSNWRPSRVVERVFNLA